MRSFWSDGLGFSGSKRWFAFRSAVQAIPLSSSMRSENIMAESSLGGGFKHFLFSSLFGEDSHFD